MHGERWRWQVCCVALVMLLVSTQSRGEDTAPARALHVGGFADVELHTASENDREGRDHVELDLFSTLQLSNSWSALGEAVLLHSWRSGDQKGDANLERLYVEYSTSDALRVEIGETQTGIVRWNEREHRSRFLQTPIDLPAIARRPQDDGAWPLRFVGVWASGRVAGPLGVGWGAGAGAGPGAVRDAMPLFSGGRSPAALLSLSVSPDATPGLQLAAAAYAGNVRLDSGRIRERDVTLSVDYFASGNEVRGEWARMNHRLSSTGVTYRTTGYYILFSKRLSGRAERVRPYLLLDRLTIARGEAYLAEADNENAWATGLRYDVTQRFSVKGEYRSQRAVNRDRETVVGVQLGLSF